jgi:hypothetical protein
MIAAIIVAGAVVIVAAVYNVAGKEGVALALPKHSVCLYEAARVAVVARGYRDSMSLVVSTLSMLSLS